MDAPEKRHAATFLERVDCWLDTKRIARETTPPPPASSARRFNAARWPPPVGSGGASTEVRVDGSKVQINKSARLRPCEHGVTATGMWSKTISKSRGNVAALIGEAIKVLEATRGAEEFRADNEKYQRLLGEYVDAIRAVGLS